MGKVLKTSPAATTPQQVEIICARAARASALLDAMGRQGRATLLHDAAAELDAVREQLVAQAQTETHLPAAKLAAEVERTSQQLRFLGRVIEEGSYLDIAIDTAAPQAVPPRQDLRRIARPRGPVAVFAASNFPLAFSVAGGDTASALAAGCAVVVKTHEGHPLTSELAHGALRAAARRHGVDDAVQTVHGQRAGLELLAHPAIKAAGFTGSVAAGRTLLAVANGRDEPIPFYGELGSLNIEVVTAGAAAQSGDSLADAIAASNQIGLGQMCTKPGLVLLPAGPAGDRVQQLLVDAFQGTTAGELLNERTSEKYREGVEGALSLPGVRLLATGRELNPAGGSLPVLMSCEARIPDERLLEEIFGPALVLTRYDSPAHLADVLARTDGALTGTVHTPPRPDEEDVACAQVALERFEQSTGRVVWNGQPTGVAVSWAMHHGGPWPASTDATATSVGAAALRRWTRPVCYQGVPERWLPVELRDESCGVPRRIDGELCMTEVNALTP